MKKSQRLCVSTIIYATLVLFFLTPFYPVLAGKPSQEEQFHAHESIIYNLIDHGLEPLEKQKIHIRIEQSAKLNNAKSIDNLSATISTAGEVFGETSDSFSGMKIPDGFSHETRDAMKEIHLFFTMGFKALEQSMGYFSQYQKNHDPAMRAAYSLKYQEGFTLIDGGLTCLETLKRGLFPEEFKNVWVKERLYNLRSRSIPNK
ncbi:hypothetical protein V3851_20985 [Paenibacillus sp. M1]|mgnify:CR=1 FL=1|uniref:Uncharacterized protein n=2 Tax=Paenibacillus TaxID=44249 RepID=A0A3P3TXW2_9BACL|nr:hypothetical protein [Paenibacillus oralis]RRJ62945.1 hypothetical protein EHV15_08420 [Paenibacillus oralis]